MKKFLAQAASAVAITALTSAVNVYVSKKVSDYMNKKGKKRR
jgi:hypothetical protein